MTKPKKHVEKAWAVQVLETHGWETRLLENSRRSARDTKRIWYWEYPARVVRVEIKEIGRG